jgi:hypothetical protein
MAVPESSSGGMDLLDRICSRLGATCFVAFGYAETGLSGRLTFGYVGKENTEPFTSGVAGAVFDPLTREVFGVMGRLLFLGAGIPRKIEMVRLDGPEDVRLHVVGIAMAGHLLALGGLPAAYSREISLLVLYHWCVLPVQLCPDATEGRELSFSAQFPEDVRNFVADGLGELSSTTLAIRHTTSQLFLPVLA